MPFLLAWTDFDLNHIAEWLSRVSFARPWALWLLVLVPAAALLTWLAARARRRNLRRFGGVGPFFGFARRRSRRIAHLCFMLGLILLVIGVAGPRWGVSEEENVAVGRDLIVVLDLSRSMLAEDMTANAQGEVSRWAVARDSLLRLADAVERRGGHRLGLVVFAAKPAVLVPLTTDYDHFRIKLDEIDARYPPPRIGPQDDPVRSGTRIGAAIERAVAGHDERFLGYQDVLLLSDGDDPLSDQEWQIGISAARRAEIPVHAVGVGDPSEESLIPLGRGQVLELNTIPVRTRLHEDVLSQIARQTRGLYLPTRRDPPDLGAFFLSRIEPRPSRELPDDALPRPRDRAAWFFGPALVLLLLAWWLEDRAPRGARGGF